MENKIFKHKKSFYDYLKKEYIKDSDSYGSSVSNTISTLFEFIDDDFNKVDFKKLNKAVKKYVSLGNWDNNNSLYSRWSSSDELLDIENSRKLYFFKVSWSEKKLSPLDLLGLTPDEALMLYEENKQSLPIMEIVYQHLSNIGEYDKAEQVFTSYMSSLPKEKLKKVAILSNVPHDFKAVFSFYKKSKTATINKKTIGSYLFKALQNREYPLDRDLYKFVYQNFKKEVSKADRFETVSTSNNDDENISVFDIFENDSNFANRVATLSNYEHRNYFEKMFKEDPERMKAAVIKFLNNKFGNTKAKMRFIRVYNRISDFLERRNDKLNILELNERLQSYVLLEIMQ
jgi:hypothetical protein